MPNLRLRRLSTSLNLDWSPIAGRRRVGMGKHPTDQSEEIFEATKERSHCVIGGIEVVEYDQADSDQAELASAATGSDGTPEIETAHDDAEQ